MEFRSVRTPAFVEEVAASGSSVGVSTTMASRVSI
jgi:hypothetical protein